MSDSSLGDDLVFEVDESLEDEVPVAYDIATYPSDFTLQGIVDMWDQKGITIPEFQREYVWSIRQASLLIDSFLLGLPVPPVFFYIDDENKNLVIDGQQRILTIVYYFGGYFGNENFQGRRQVFRLQGLDERDQFYRKRFEDLSESHQRKLKNSVLRAINIRQLAPSEGNTSIYHIFERLNTGGTPLRPQEIRNVVFRGKIVDLLRELNRDPSWRTILGTSNYNKHQTDVELVLRILALSYTAAKYEKPMKEYLNQAMKRNRDGDTPGVNRFQERFPRAAKLIAERFEAKPFHLRGRLNTSALDSVFCTVMDNLERLPVDLESRFAQLKQDPEFEELTTTGTTDTQVVRSRFKLVERYFLGR